MRAVLMLPAVLAAGALAGLEDATHSRKLTALNFDAEIAHADKGALVAFFAPWCGHCKNLAPAWDQVAADFQNEDGCILGHLNADELVNKPIAERYGVSGYPTLKFFPGKGQAPMDYHAGRSEDALRAYVNEHCGTDRQPGGALGVTAGRVPGLDAIARQFLKTPALDRANLLASARSIAQTVPHSSASYYLKVMEKLDVQSGFITTELARLQKLAERKGAVAGRKLDELQLRRNILHAFETLKDGVASMIDQASDTVEGAVGAVESVVRKAGEEL